MKIKKDPGVFLLGLPSNDVSLPSRKFELQDKLLLLARKGIFFKMDQGNPSYCYFVVQRDV